MGVATQVPQSVVQVTEHPSGQRQVQQQSTVTVTGAANLIPHQAQAVIASLAQAQQLQVSDNKIFFLSYLADTVC